MTKMHRVRSYIKALFIIAAVLTSGVMAHDAQAASGGLTVSPTSIDTEVAPGSSYKGEMLVLNQSELPTDYQVYVTPYSVSGEEYKPYFSPVKGAVDITKWFTIGKTSGSLKVGDQHTIPFTITVPKGTGAGSYFATIFAETKDKGTSGVVTRKRVGMIVYLRVSGNAIEKGSLDQWDVPFLQEAPLTATAKIANPGSVHFRAKVSMTVSDIFGNEKFTYENAPEVLPQKLRSIPISWQNGATFGLFKVSGKVSYLGKTETLPTKFVLVANTAARLAVIGALLLLLTLGVVYMGRKRAATPQE